MSPPIGMVVSRFGSDMVYNDFGLGWSLGICLLSTYFPGYYAHGVTIWSLIFYLESILLQQKFPTA